jgi:hypothetical protein
MHRAAAHLGRNAGVAGITRKSSRVNVKNSLSVWAQNIHVAIRSESPSSIPVKPRLPVAWARSSAVGQIAASIEGENQR